MQEQFKAYLHELLYQLADTDSELALLVLLIVVTIIILDAINHYTRKKSKEAGISNKVTAISIDGSDHLPGKTYVSDMQGLAGRPDALIQEHGNLVPVERKPLSRKIRDRHIAQLLVYMRLVEEFEGKKPPYGYLIIGKSCRRFKIYNSPERQAWLQRMIDEMRGYLVDKKPVKASPHPKKCKRCNVRNDCSFRADIQAT